MNDALAATMVVGASKVVEVLSKIADTKLHNTAKLFTDALAGAVTATATRIVVKMEGVAKDIEVGYPSRDLKPKLLASPNAKTSEKGNRYIDVPFKHEMRANVRSQGMPPLVKAQIQAAVQTERISARWGGRAERNPLRVTGTIPAASSKHVTSVYSDMLRTRSSGKSSYQTIRRISSNSDANAWWHPGYEGLRALRQLKNFPKLVLKSIFKREMVKRGLRSK